MRRNSLALPYAKHKNRTRKKDLTKPFYINRLCETYIHYVSTHNDRMAHLMSIKDFFSKKWISYEFSRSCIANYCIRAVEKASTIRFPQGNAHDLGLRKDKDPQYISEIFEKMNILGIKSEYTQKHTPEDIGILNHSIALS